MPYKDFDQGKTSIQINKEKQHFAAMARRDDMENRWSESERILSILRAIVPAPPPEDPKLINKWYDGLPPQRSSWAPDPGEDDPMKSPSNWFKARFPDQVRTFGDAFIDKGDPNRSSHELFLNKDFFAAILGGEQSLGHQVVFCPLENEWYFWDPMADAFCRTTTEKLQILVSNYLLRCAQAFRGNPKIEPLMDDFRKPNMLQAITSKSKTILEAANTFFEGPNGKARYIDGFRVEATDEPAHCLFVREAIEGQPGSQLTVDEAFGHYSRFCKTRHLPALRMVEFRNEVAAEIQSIFNQKVRHDLAQEDGKQTHGWHALALYNFSEQAKSRSVAFAMVPELGVS